MTLMSLLWRPLGRPARALILGLARCLLLLPLCMPWHAAHAEAGFLEPGQAFRLSARASDARTVELHWEIAQGYYLYRERFAIAALPAAVELGEPAYPAGKVKFDETFQKDVETYRGAVQVSLPVVTAPAEFKLAVTSQGCADQGLCYPPRQQSLRVQVRDGAIVAVNLLDDATAASWSPPEAGPAQALVAGPARTAAPIQPAGLLALAGGGTSGFGAALQSGSLWTVAGVFLLAGVLLSFTPCVLPMVPILSSIIVGQGGPVSRARGLTLSLAYALGMALVYTAFGVAAGLAGEGLAAALQTPWVLGGFALLLVALSLSMFGVYELQLPSALQTRLSSSSGRLPGGRLGAVFVMGGVSALIVGPCVAAPLAGALLYISQTRDVVLGGLALFAMAVGMSVPLLLVGVSAGSLLPRAGAWMDGVKRLFGVLLVAVAIWMVTPVLPPWAVMLAWGSLLLLCAVGLRLFDPLPPQAGFWPRLGKGVGLVLALAGAAQLVGAFSGARNPLQPLAHLSRAQAGSSSAEAPSLAFRRIKTVAELDEALRTAGRPVMLDFYADWCVSCKEYERYTFRDAQVQARLSKVLLLQADVTANDDDDKALLKRFSLFGPPGIMFFDGQGQELAEQRVIGYQPADQFLESLTAAGL